MKKIIIIGGGPAGMMAAIRAAELGASVILLEKNDKLGKKLLLTGKGRCNVTNAGDLDDFLKRFRCGGNFLRDAFKVFFNDDVMKFFKDQGVPLKVERQQRVFPESDRASSILNVLIKSMKNFGVDVHLNARVKKVNVENGEVVGVVLFNGKVICADALVLATGGLSYAWTGSSGDGIDFAQKSGHRIIPMRPALVGLEAKESFCKQLEGLALKNILLVFSNGRKKIKTDIGELLFTARGISGPLVVTHSGQVVDWLDMKKEVFVEVDLKPALNSDVLERRLKKEFEQAPRKVIKNLLKSLLPQRLIDVFLDVGKIDPNKPVNQISQKERACLIDLLKCFRMNIVKTGSFEKAMVTQGGISVRDVDPKTMESRRVKGLFFAGEIMDVDGDTGGFNLQAAFSTGYLAGQSCING